MSSDYIHHTASGLIAPIVNLNGTSREALIREMLDAINAIHAALEKVRQTCPHGRDYPSGLGLALAQHRDRCASLERARDELQEIAESIR